MSLWQWQKIQEVSLPKLEFLHFVFGSAYTKYAWKLPFFGLHGELFLIGH